MTVAFSKMVDVSVYSYADYGLADVTASNATGKLKKKYSNNTTACLSLSSLRVNFQS